jgi:hypothetical protein
MRKSSGVQCSFSISFVISSVCDSCFTHDFIMSKKHHDSYVQYGIIFMLDEDGLQMPQCFLCSEVLSNGYMKPTRLKEHLQTANP